jgi:hypothetical protein
MDSSRGIKIDHEISPQPARVGPVTVTLKVTDSAAGSVTGARIKLEANMTHAGMSPVVGGMREIAPGRYQGDLAFQMAGDWVILLHVTLPDGSKLERQFDVPGVRPN